MAMTLLLGEGSEEAYLAKVEELIGRSLETKEVLTAVSFRNLGYGANYTGHHIIKYAAPSTRGDHG